MKIPVLIGLVCLITGSVIGWRLRPAPPPAFPRVITDTVAIYRERPVAVIRWRDRIRWRSVPPAVVATGPEGEKDTAAVTRYCTTLRDTSRAQAPATLPDFRGRMSGPTLQLWSTLSDGRAWYSSTTVHGSMLQWLSNSDSVIVREERVGFRLFRGLPGKVLLFGTGVLAGKILLH